MRIMAWQVHGGWMDAFTQGAHEYLVPDLMMPASEADGTGNVHRVGPERLRDQDVDMVVLQRVEEIEAARRLLGREPGRDVPAVFVEHNTPKRNPVSERHPLAEQNDIPVVHVTHFNRLVWDSGIAPTRVIEHGIPDPGPLYTGEVDALGVVVNEPVRRWRVTGTDLLARFATAGRLDVFGIDADLLPDALPLGPDRLRIMGDLRTQRLHAELARRRAYLHTCRWTSLGLSLLEAMFLGMPVIALGTTEALRAVPPEAGAISTDPDDLAAAAARLLADPDEARRRGRAARAFVRERYGLERFHRAWDELLAEQVASHVERDGHGGPPPSTPSPAITPSAPLGANTKGTHR